MSLRKALGGYTDQVTAEGLSTSRQVSYEAFFFAGDRISLHSVWCHGPSIARAPHALVSVLWDTLDDRRQR